MTTHQLAQQQWLFNKLGVPWPAGISDVEGRAALIREALKGRDLEEVAVRTNQKKAITWRLAFRAAFGVEIVGTDDIWNTGR